MLIKIRLRYDAYRQSLYIYSNVNRLFLNVIYHLDNTSMTMILFAVLMCELNSATKMLFLTCFLETQAADQHKSLQVNYAISRKLT